MWILKITEICSSDYAGTQFVLPTAILIARICTLYLCT